MTGHTRFRAGRVDRLMTNTQTALMDGTRVYFTSLTGLIDSSVAGTVTDAYPIDPGTGRPNREFAWVRWDDGTHELDSIDNLVTVASTKDPS